LWRKSWCFISSIKSNKLKPQKNQKMVWLLDYWVVHKNKDFFEWMKEKILTFWWFLYLPILQMPFNQLMLLCSIKSNMHSKWFQH
jgi:hypothetical protein